jgi:hypothetical protein
MLYYANFAWKIAKTELAMGPRTPQRAQNEQAGSLSRRSGGQQPRILASIRRDFHSSQTAKLRAPYQRRERVYHANQDWQRHAKAGGEEKAA